MLGKELLTYVDHTLLRPIATWDEIKVICEDALAYHTASVCIPPDFVASAHNAYPNLNVCTVIGFPLGYQTTESKVAYPLTIFQAPLPLHKKMELRL